MEVVDSESFKNEFLKEYLSRDFSSLSKKRVRCTNDASFYEVFRYTKQK